MKTQIELIKSFDNKDYCLLNATRQICFEGANQFTNNHDYQHLTNVMRNVQILIIAYSEYHNYWIKKYGTLFKAKRMMSRGAFYHDLMRDKSSTEEHGEHLFQLWKENKLPYFLPPINFEIAQAIRRHTFPLPKDCTIEDIFLKTADSLDMIRYGYEINKDLLPLEDCQERIKKLKEFKFINFVPKVSIEEINKVDKFFSKKLNKGIKKNFVEEKKKIGDPLPPKVEDEKLEKLLEKLRGRMNQEFFERYRGDNLKAFAKKLYPKHNFDECPCLDLLIEFGEGQRDHFSFQGVFDYDLKYLYEIKKYLPKKILARHLLYYYLTSSHPTLSVGSVNLAKMFEMVEPQLKKLMRDYEKEQYNKLPKKVKVYRGFGEVMGEGIVPEVALGVSWADKIDIARGFANTKRCGDKHWLKGYVVSGIVDKKDILFLRVPTESILPELYEIFINPLKIKDIQIVEVFNPPSRVILEDKHFIDGDENHINSVEKFMTDWKNKNMKIIKRK